MINTRYLKGARPVPGPTMMQGMAGSAGNRKVPPLRSPPVRMGPKTFFRRNQTTKNSKIFTVYAASAMDAHDQEVSL